jgi:tRNA G18 (ribose-2'-O)-methylase SpoU
VHYSDLETLTGIALEGYSIYAAAMDGSSVYDLPVDFPAAIVIGNESRGISDEILAKSHQRITIPSLSSQAESLNASVATGILCAEFTRQLKAKK